MVLGLDIGSCYTKGVLFDNGIKDKLVVRTSMKPGQAIEEIKKVLRGHDKICATGFGRELVCNADSILTEITAFTRGALYLNSGIKTIIDVGGQDSKIIRIKNNKVDRFVMNDRCAAGTGNFVEKIAQALELTLDDFAELAVRSHNPEMIDSLCVVMAESEILSLVAAGKKMEDIVAGVCDSLIRRIINIGNQIGIEAPVLFCGGSALNPGIVKSIEHIIGNVILPAEPQFVGAIGAALSIQT